ncbi:hypothetical protein UFOVP909_61 [uncultured Caudovirales phage]|uniref:Uncharacterized protein n=1 Tax=uncultured Caudovirales phage TaxID=2100421 RepID=A0A6J5PHB6_9CAUD|nr:hypothetical protein UFOVP909_61 [uncultured Caudovirales phage]CAB4182305.1 hypothetical protein UFOVP1066_210 [uncultured Caudovirales phage]CAB4198516.1 hypothetical protein UFOVP1315_127 [uncultured Caudovirales phage]CAB4211481.1 hypothetical protein UFOVP1421_88 [uncultured Caudovirales phage]CAB5238594.1 hypothetical protein UFOVP1525_98 [uncultured Caudovirales phage]
MTSILVDNKGLDIWLLIQVVGVSALTVIGGIVALVWVIEKFLKK